MSFPTPSTSVGPVIKTQHVGSDLVIDLGLTCLVASASCPDSWHEVVTTPAHCTCAAWAFRGKCRHHAAAVQVQMSGIETASPIVAPPAAVPADGADAFPFTVPSGKGSLALGSLDDDADYYSAEAIKERRGYTVKVLDAQPVGQHPSQSERWL